MTFLNLALAFGAAACAIPVIIHLFNRSRFEVVPWGAMHLLESVVRVNRRRLRIEQLLLLLIRMAVLAALAMCMASPVLTGCNSLSGNARTSLALLVDNSYSMEAGGDGLTNLQIANREAASVIAAQPRGSDVAVELLAGGRVIGSTAATNNLAKAAKEIEMMDGGFASAEAPQSLESAAARLDKMQHAKRDLVVISDFQATDWRGDAAPSLQRAQELLDAMPLRPAITLMPVGVSVEDNVCVRSLDISPRTIGVDAPVRIRVNLQNFGPTPYPSLRVLLKVDGKDIASESLDLAATSSGQIVFEHRFEKSGSRVVEVVAEADSLRADNLFAAVLRVWAPLPVLLVDGDPDPSPLRNETGYLRVALSPFAASEEITGRGGADSENEAADLLHATSTTAADLDAADLQGQRLVVLANVARLSERQATALEQFVRAGNALLVFDGPNLDTSWYNARWCDPERRVLPLALGEIRRRDPKPDDTQDTGEKLELEHRDHPAMDLFNDRRNGRLADIRVRSWRQLTGAQDNQGVDVVARLENGDPFIAEHEYGAGRVMVCASTCDDAWNNLPARPLFVPLMQDLTAYLSTAIEPELNIKAGQTIVASLAKNVEAVITTPHGQQVELSPRVVGEREIIEFNDTRRPGVYTIKPSQGEPIRYAVSADRRESDLQRLTAEELQGLAESLNATVVSSASDYASRDERLRFGREIWRELYWLLLLLVVGEIILQQIFARGRLWLPKFKQWRLSFPRFPARSVGG